MTDRLCYLLRFYFSPRAFRRQVRQARVCLARIKTATESEYNVQLTDIEPFQTERYIHRHSQRDNNEEKLIAKARDGGAIGTKVLKRVTIESKDRVESNKLRAALLLSLSCCFSASLDNEFNYAQRTNRRTNTIFLLIRDRFITFLRVFQHFRVIRYREIFLVSFRHVAKRDRTTTVGILRLINRFFDSSKNHSVTRFTSRDRRISNLPKTS